jgi:hypothetical protein
MRCAVFALVGALLAAPAAADVCDNVSVECEVVDLGGDVYEFIFNVSNGSPEPNAIFFWVLNPGSAPAAWETIEWTLPDGWVASHPGPQLHFFATDNASGNPWRMYSPSASACGTTFFEFRWKFWNNGGPTPECMFTPLDYTFHMQGVDPGICLNVGDSFVCPPPVPVEPTTWGQIKQLYEDN